MDDEHGEQKDEKKADGNHQEDTLNSARAKEPASAHAGATGLPIVKAQQGSVVQETPPASTKADKNRAKRQRKKLQAAPKKAQAATTALSDTITSEVALPQRPPKRPDKQTLKRQGEVSHNLYLVPSILRFRVPWLQSINY